MTRKKTIGYVVFEWIIWKKYTHVLKSVFSEIRVRTCPDSELRKHSTLIDLSFFCLSSLSNGNSWIDHSDWSIILLCSQSRSMFNQSIASSTYRNEIWLHQYFISIFIQYTSTSGKVGQSKLKLSQFRLTFLNGKVDQCVIINYLIYISTYL